MMSFHKMTSSGLEAEFGALDEVFEHYGPLEFDVEAFIDSQFDLALRDEEESVSTDAFVTAKDLSKMVVEREDGRTVAADAINSFGFTYGSDTQIDFAEAISSSSPQDEIQGNGRFCSRCREILDKDDFESCFASSKTTATRKAVSEGYVDESGTDPRNAVVTELQLSDISDDVGTCWRELGPNLNIKASKIHNLEDEYRTNRDKANALLIMWKQQEGRNATVGCLADILKCVERKSIAEKLLGKSKTILATSVSSVSDGKTINITVKYNLNTEADEKVMLCEDAHGNKFIVKAISNCEEGWNSEKIQKNKEFLETVAAAAKDLDKTEEQKRQESLKRISSEVQELRQQLKRIKLDSSDAPTCSGNSDPIRNTEPSNGHLKDAKRSPQDVTHLLHSCEEQHSFCQRIYNGLIQLIGEVAQLGEDNVMCIKQLYEFTKELKDQEKSFIPKIELLHNSKKHLNQMQAAQVEQLEKWSRAQKEQVQGVEKLLSSLLHQGKNRKLLKRRSEPVMVVKPSYGFVRRRTKTDSSKSSRKWQSLSELPDADKKFSISAPVCVHQLHCLDADKKLKNEKS